jgi:hypothetical protein
LQKDLRHAFDLVGGFGTHQGIGRGMRALPDFWIAFLSELHYAMGRVNYLQIWRKFLSFVLFGLQGNDAGWRLTG